MFDTTHPVDKDIYVYYNGGSGGFIALHGILLTNHFECSKYTDSLISTTHIINSVWDNQTSDSSMWKTTEIWPDNKQTSLLSDKLRCYFSCNPQLEETSKFCKDKDVLYIKIWCPPKIQFHLAQFKHAFIFYDSALDISTTYEEFISYPWKTFYNNVKDESWPNCDNISDVSLLPDHIQDELHNTFNMHNVNFNDRIQVFDKTELPEDFSFNLIDIVQTKFKNITDALGLPHTQEHIDLMDKWINLHSSPIQDMLLGIKN